MALTPEQELDATIISRALNTYICELEEARDGMSTNIRWSESAYNRAKELDKKFGTGRYYVVRDF
jgi:hypothetical protein